MEAFSDGVVAILITIMVLELRAPHEASLAGLRPLIPVMLSYLLSFVFLGIYWNNHHHLLQAAERSGALGQPSFVILAVSNSLCHRMDGRESFH